MTPKPTVALLNLHLDSLPYLKVVQFRWLSEILASLAPSMIPFEFHIATAMKAANHKTIRHARSATVHSYSSVAPVPQWLGNGPVYNASRATKA